MLTAPVGVCRKSSGIVPVPWEISTPEFLLPAANRDGIVSLSGFLSRGTLIVEFLRGTW